MDIFDEVLNETISAPPKPPRGRRYPLCTEWVCDIYFTPQQIISLVIILLRISIAILILLLGTKMEKDFMRSISNTIFLSILASELFTVYCEICYYIDLFSTTAEISLAFYETYLSWTSTFVFVLYNYIHFNIMVMLSLILYCARIATHPGDRINALPTNAICMILQVVPFFLCILTYVENLNEALVLKILAAISKVVTIFCFVTILIQVLMSIVVMMRELPYEAATSVDMQIRDARSRLAWTCVYVAIPFVTLIPSFVDSIFYVFQIDGGRESFTRMIKVVCDLCIYVINFYRPTWMVLITMAFLPPYRRAVPLLFCCCSCCPKMNVEPLPRKGGEMSLMYRYADI